MFQFIQITTTSDQKETLEKIAAQLLAEKMAACIQIMGPIESHYHWDGQCQMTKEWICHIKTHRSKFDLVEQSIQQIHHYDEPEVVALPIVQGSQGYLQWLATETT